jgi:hypothetical protein
MAPGAPGECAAASSPGLLPSGHEPTPVRLDGRAATMDQQQGSRRVVRLAVPLEVQPKASGGVPTLVSHSRNPNDAPLPGRSHLPPRQRVGRRRVSAVAVARYFRRCRTLPVRRTALAIKGIRAESCNSARSFEEAVRPADRRGGCRPCLRWAGVLPRCVGRRGERQNSRPTWVRPTRWINQAMRVDAGRRWIRVLRPGGRSSRRGRR